MGADGATGRDRPAGLTGATLPDYGGACVTSVVPAALGARSRDVLPATARDARAIVLLVLDGLGWAALHEHGARLGTLSSMQGGPITTVLPSTTSTVLASLTTGSPAAEHGIVGMRMLFGDTVLNALRWTASIGEPPDPIAVQPVAPFGGRAAPVVTRAQFQRSGFTVAHLRGARYHGYSETSTLVERIRRLVSSGEEFVYAYYDGVDHLAHVRGLGDSFYDAELRFADRLVADVLDVLPGDTALVVTADHGQVDLPSGSWMHLPDAVLERVRAQAGEMRWRYLYGSPDLADVCRETLGDVAWVLTRQEIDDARLLGPEAMRPEVAARLGDVLIAARAPVAFIDPSMPEEVRLRSGHGSMTADEMLVPLVGARGRA